ncbi:MAG: PDZ domain-containing protein [Candidatus Portnoybacteria bacterium]|nr:PDZ domain-containing protein [Candidatus Portnoybacteria bacterium]
MIITIIVFILILGLLIFVHEFGHFISAKKAGVKVEEFGFGFPPRLFSFKRGETVYSLNLFPIGGFVRLYGEERGEKAFGEKAFHNKAIWKRAIILVMGVVMNLFIAGVLLSFVHGIGIPSVVEEGSGLNYSNVQIQILEIAEESPASEADLRIGDSILYLSSNFDRVDVNDTEDVQKFVAAHAGEEIKIGIKRGKETLEKTIVPRLNPPAEEGAVGIAMAKTGLVSYPWYQAILKGFKSVGHLFVVMIQMFYLLIKTLILEGTMIGNVSGPVGIAVFTGQVVDLGLAYVLQFAAILSINLAILNLIPIPALDGGRLLFLLIEKIKGSPIKVKT